MLVGIGNRVEEAGGMVVAHLCFPFGSLLLCFLASWLCLAGRVYVMDGMLLMDCGDRSQGLLEEACCLFESANKA